MKPRSHSRHWLVIALQGPRRPWWLAPVMVFLGGGAAVCGLAVLDNSRIGVVMMVFGTTVAVVGAVWWWMRVAEWRHYRRFAMQEVWEACPRCAYTLEGLNDEQCPECGEDLEKLRRTLSRRGSEWF